MITNFEEYTKELTVEEMKLLPLLMSGFKKRTKENPVKAPEIIAGINKTGVAKITEPRLRKLCNFIRSKSILPLIATSNGYYISYDPDEVSRQIQSLEERASAIMESTKGLKKFLNQS